jgi:ATP-dependent DNA ligase
MLADLRDKPASVPQWALEIKWDGWRLQAHKRSEGRQRRFLSTAPM